MGFNTNLIKKSLFLDEEEDENNNEHDEECQANVKETDETVYEDTDSSSIASPVRVLKFILTIEYCKMSFVKMNIDYQVF